VHGIIRGVLETSSNQFKQTRPAISHYEKHLVSNDIANIDYVSVPSFLGSIKEIAQASTSDSKLNKEKQEDITNLQYPETKETEDIAVSIDKSAIHTSMQQKEPIPYLTGNVEIDNAKSKGMSISSEKLSDSKKVQFVTDNLSEGKSLTAQSIRRSSAMKSTEQQKENFVPPSLLIGEETGKLLGWKTVPVKSDENNPIKQQEEIFVPPPPMINDETAKLLG